MEVWTYKYIRDNERYQSMIHRKLGIINVHQVMTEKDLLGVQGEGGIIV